MRCRPTGFYRTNAMIECNKKMVIYEYNLTDRHKSIPYNRNGTLTGKTVKKRSNLIIRQKI